ncbi:hypothetical protein PISMIDRAFT_15708 [Pisolithus microcarpus 441]|uniref:Uncharacterized protein n=1 Tax=Pisolithus microcarpus 441 TaxID=765257 RepID=A0A0C9Z9P9_9AGAM|nr:hypothetical protein PISMIDRAFT_15708 [Pisolithus microcarpus 441]
MPNRNNCGFAGVIMNPTTNDRHSVGKPICAYALPLKPGFHTEFAQNTFLAGMKLQNEVQQLHTVYGYPWPLNLLIQTHEAALPCKLHQAASSSCADFAWHMDSEGD